MDIANAPVIPRGNAWIAAQLRQAADLVAAQDANPFRAGAYRRAAGEIDGLKEDLRAIVDAGGVAALDAIPGIGPSIASAVMEMLGTGRWGFLERLKGSTDPEALFCTLPGMGPELAHRVQEQLHLDSLEALEVAAHDGRLAAVPGFGARRVAMVRTALAELLFRLRPPPGRATEEPGVGILLDVDCEYLAKAMAGTLRRIAPRRFTPSGAAWLPILHTEPGPWHFTTLYSNTARAHQLGRATDWVVVYFHRDTQPDGRRTMVTENQGPARGRRVVRGREADCRDWYAAHPDGTSGG